MQKYCLIQDKLLFACEQKKKLDVRKKVFNKEEEKFENHDRHLRSE